MAELCVCLEVNLKPNSTDWDCKILPPRLEKKKKKFHLSGAPPRNRVCLFPLMRLSNALVQTDNLCECVAHLWQPGLRNQEKDHSQTEQRSLCLLNNGAQAAGF